MDETAWQSCPGLFTLVIRARPGTEIPEDAKPIYQEIAGLYEHAGLFSGKPMYKKTTGVTTNEAVVYYCNEQWLPDERGWWMGPRVGGELIWAYSRSSAIDIPSAGWHCVGMPSVQLQVVPQMVLLREKLDGTLKDYSSLFEENMDLKATHAAAVADMEELETKYAQLQESYKNLLKDSNRAPPVKKPRVVPPPADADAVRQWTAADKTAPPNASQNAWCPQQPSAPPPPHLLSGSASSSGAPAPDAPGRTRARTRAGVRVQAQRIVDLLISGQVDEIRRQTDLPRFHW
jgi:hypothetical protein